MLYLLPIFWSCPSLPPGTSSCGAWEATVFSVNGLLQRAAVWIHGEASRCVHVCASGHREELRMENVE